MSAQGQNLTRIFRAESGRLLAVLVKQCGDIQCAEDALQEAFASATTKWQSTGTPRCPEAWLLTVARRRLIDNFRQSEKFSNQAILDELQQSLSPKRSNEQQYDIPEERLRLIFTCCHPALNQSAQIALTLKTLCGFSSGEIARAFLISETTLNQRLVRAKQKIKLANIPYQIPTKDALPERLDTVLSVLYLIFNESYSAYEGQTFSRDDIALEAIRLGRVIHKLMPSPAVTGLLALMLLHHARARSRANATYGFIPLQHQDRTQWDTEMISEGSDLLLSALSLGQPEQYQIQASISALHSQADSWEATDWKQIVLLYAELYKASPSPVVKLNGIMALAHSGKLNEALEEIKDLEKTLKDYQPFYAARAELYSMAAKYSSAYADLEAAISLSCNDPVRDYLKRKLNDLENKLGYQ